MAKHIDYKLENGKTVRIPKEEIERNMKGLDLTEQDAILVWLEDNDYIENAEQIALDQKAKDSKITATIHQARADKPQGKRKVERKPDQVKDELVENLKEFLCDLAQNVQIVKVGKLIEFDIGNDHYKLDLIRQRPPKAKGQRYPLPNGNLQERNIEEQKVICPVCGGEVREDDVYDYGIYTDETVEECVGTCLECGRTIEYNRVYPHKDYKIEIVDHYKD